MKAAALLLLLASPALARESVEACRAAYLPSYAAEWRISRGDWDDACAAGRSAPEALRERQRLFIESCVARFPPHAALTAFDVQVQCARGVAGESRLGPPPGEPSAPVPRPKFGTGTGRRLTKALGLARAEHPDACLSAIYACFQCAPLHSDPEPYDSWKFFFYSPATDERHMVVDFDKHDHASLGRDMQAAPFCVQPRVDTADAIETALRGVDEQKGMFIEVGLQTISDKRRTVAWDTQVWERFPDLRGRLLWRVYAQGVNVLIDARSGKVVGRY